jgi:hypothetical protein
VAQKSASVLYVAPLEETWKEEAKPNQIGSWTGASLCVEPFTDSVSRCNREEVGQLHKALPIAIGMVLQLQRKGWKSAVMFLCSKFTWKLGFPLLTGAVHFVSPPDSYRV